MMLKEIYFESDVSDIAENIFKGTSPELIVYGNNTPNVQVYTVLNNVKFRKAPSMDVFRYSLINDEEIKVTGMTDTSCTELVIPGYIKGYKVSQIGDWAFEANESLRGVVIPDTVKVIGEGAFYGTLIESVVIGRSVERIGKDAFAENPYLSEIFFLSDVTIGIEDNVFNSCDRLAPIIPDDYKGNENIKAYFDDMFIPYTFLDDYLCLTYTVNNNEVIITGLKSHSCPYGHYKVDIPSSINGMNVIGISGEAFMDNGEIVKIILPRTLREIGPMAFASCTMLNEIEIDKLNNYFIFEDGILYDNTKTEIVSYLAVNKESDYEVSEDIAVIRSGAFYGNENLASVTIGSNVGIIGDGALSSCNNLLTILVHPSNTVFVSVNGILYKYIPAIIEGKNYGLRLISYPAGKKDTYFLVPYLTYEMSSYALAGAFNLTEIFFEEDVYNPDYDLELVLKGIIDKIEIYTPFNSRIDDIVTPELNEYCFGYVETDQNKVVITGMVCGHNHKDIVVPLTLFGKQVIGIASYAFQNNSHIRSIKLPNSVTAIGSYAFTGSSLEYITFGSKIASVGIFAFSNCANLEEVLFVSDVGLNGNIFANSPKVTIYGDPIENGLISAYCTANSLSFKTSDMLECFLYSEVDEEIIITGVKKHYCLKGHKEIVIPEFINEKPVVAIAGGAFANISNLNSLSIPIAVTFIDVTAFDGCDKLAELIIDPANPSYVFKDSSLYDALSNKILTLTPSRDTVNPAIKAVTESHLLTYKIVDSGVENEEDTITITGADKDLTQLVLPKYLKGLRVKAIEDYAFAGHKKLQTIIIYDYIEQIGVGAFAGIETLATLKIYNKKYTIEYDPATKAKMLIEHSERPSGEEGINIPYKILHTYFASNTAEEFIVPNDVAIGEGAFYGNNFLTNIIIPATIEEIGAGAFTSCKSLINIDVLLNPLYEFTNGNLYDIRNKDEAGNNITLHTHLNSNVHAEGDEPYRFHSSISNIAARAFENTGIRKVIINPNILSIGKYAFNGCNSMTRVYFEDDISALGYESINGVAEGCRVYGPDYGFLPGYFAFEENKDIDYYPWTPYENFEYFFDEDTEKVKIIGLSTEYDGRTNIIIPHIIEGNAVNEIAENAFKDIESIHSMIFTL